VSGLPDEAVEAMARAMISAAEGEWDEHWPVHWSLKGFMGHALAALPAGVYVSDGQGKVEPVDEGARDAVVEAAIACVEAETAVPLVGVPSREQPWVQARARLAAAVEAYRLGALSATGTGGPA
jgi:hypothetical protein